MSKKPKSSTTKTKKRATKVAAPWPEPVKRSPLADFLVLVPAHAVGITELTSRRTAVLRQWLIENRGAGLLVIHRNQCSLVGASQVCTCEPTYLHCGAVA